VAGHLCDDVDGGVDVQFGTAQRGGGEQSEEAGGAEVVDHVVREGAGGLDQFGPVGEGGAEVAGALEQVGHSTKLEDTSNKYNSK